MQTQHQRTAQSRGCAQQLLAASASARAMMPLVERRLWSMSPDLAADGDAQVAAAIGRIAPQVHAQQVPRLEVPGGFLEGFAHHRIEDGFAILDMSGRLVEHQSACGCVPRRCRKRPSRCTIAATVRSGRQVMERKYKAAVRS